MVDYESDDDRPKGSRFSLRSLLIRDWPYIVMLVLAIFGVAYASVAPQAMTNYWTILGPVLGTVTAGIRHAAGWRVCLVGVVLGLGVPAIAWLEQATLLLVLIATVLLSIAVLYFIHHRRERVY